MFPDDDPLSASDALILEGRASEAVALLRGQLESGRGGLLLRLALQRALLAAGDNAGALALARETALTNPSVAVAAAALGEALCANGHLPAAIGELQRALRLDAELDDARIALGSAWLAAGEAAKAMEAWHEARNQASPVLVMGIAEAERILAAPRSDPRYVRHLFDQFSVDYDVRMLGQLGYEAPRILRQLGVFLGLGGPLAILDLGCGTGLMGQAVRDWARRLDGVDLSPAMIEKARTRGIYSSLAVGDLDDFLALGGSTYDLILAADTLVYLGDLGEIFAGVRQRLSTGGHFLFTVEAKDGDGFELGPKRRWRHAEAYLRETASIFGLRVAGFLACQPRVEAGLPVEGFAVALAASTADK